MTPVFEFAAYLRLSAADESEARSAAEEIAAAVTRGDATLALDESAPSIEDEER